MLCLPRGSGREIARAGCNRLCVPEWTRVQPGRIAALRIGYRIDPDQGNLRHIRVLDVEDGRTLKGGDVFYEVDSGVSDGIRLDTDGNVWSSAGDGVHCISPQGELLGKVLVPEKVSNLCFGGRAKHVLFMTGLHLSIPLS